MEAGDVASLSEDLPRTIHRGVNMGCASSLAAAARGDEYSSSAQKRPRQNQVVPSQEPEFRPIATPVSERQRLAPKNSSETARQRSGGSVVQSALKLRSETFVNQYRIVSSKPIGKGFQSKVRQPLPRYRMRISLRLDYSATVADVKNVAGVPRRGHE